MTFLSAIASAPADADYVSYENIGGWIIIQRRSDGAWDTCANVNAIGYDIIVAGVSARHRSLWSHDSQQFLCGTVEQVTRQEWPEDYVSEELFAGYAYRNYAGQGEG